MAWVMRVVMAMVGLGMVVLAFTLGIALIAALLIIAPIAVWWLRRRMARRAAAGFSSAQPYPHEEITVIEGDYHIVAEAAEAPEKSHTVPGGESR